MKSGVMRIERSHISGRGLGRAGLTLPLLAGFLLCACAQKVEVTSQVPVGDATPTILSGSPKQDANAYQEGDRMLQNARWGVVERRGPQPILPSEANSSPAAPAPQSASPESTSPPAPARPSAKRPVTEVSLADGRVRLIYHLEHAGGATVSVARDGGTSRRQVTTKMPDLNSLLQVVTSHLGSDGQVAPLPEQNALVITCPQAMRDSVLELLDKLDRPQRQVEITARIFEVSHDFDFQQGARVLLEHLGSTDSQSIISTFDTRRFLDSVKGKADLPFQGSALSLIKAFEDAGVSVEVSFQLLAEAGLIKVVSAPRMTVAQGQTGYLLAGQELPIQSAAFNQGILQTTTTYKPVGVQLYITPEAIGQDSVKLHVITTVSAVAGFAPLPTLTEQASPAMLINPIINSREAETAVTVTNGNTLVISGLRMVRTITRENKLPLLGDIPVLGWLFKNHRSQQQLTDLYFFVTPEIL